MSLVKSYRNPIYPSPFPDPFVLKWSGEYWAYCTGFWLDGKVFGILHSRDLVHWRELSGAMDELPGKHPCYWAPEVRYENGLFYLYYSVGNEEFMSIRVATAEHPAGPFRDSGHTLTNEQFAIDPHVFVDEDGSQFLFYATDFLEHERIGTGTVVDRMLSPFALAREPQPVTRARYDWQVYDPNRASKGFVKWHTVEGPFVLKRKGKYYEMISGGNWQNVSYGVSYAVSDTLLRENEWDQHADGENVLPILRTIPNKVLGPGHNSVIRGPDNRQLFAVYHQWHAWYDPSTRSERLERVVSIDRLEWVGVELTILGPSTTEQPSPNVPNFSGFSDVDILYDLGWYWRCRSGRWSSEAGEALQLERAGDAVASLALSACAFLVEVSVRAIEYTASEGSTRYGVRLSGADNVLRDVVFDPVTGRLVVSRDAGSTEAGVDIPGFNALAYQCLRIEVDEELMWVSYGGRVLFSEKLTATVTDLSLITSNVCAAYKGFELTYGYEHSFEQAEVGLAWNGTMTRIQGNELIIEAAEGEKALAKKAIALTDCETVINVRLIEGYSERGSYLIAPCMTDSEEGVLFHLRQQDGVWKLSASDGNFSSDLPMAFDPFQHHQWRIRKVAAELSIMLHNQLLGVIPVQPGAVFLAIGAEDAAVAFDLVRFTALA